jgi:hypothetical protein
MDFAGVLEKIPDDILLAAAARRREAMRKELGKYASVKSKVSCPYCQGGPFGVRELRRHKRECICNPRN